MKKAAYVASVMIHFKSFHIPHLKNLQKRDFETTLIAGDDMDIEGCEKKYKVPFERFPLKINNLKAYGKLKNIFKKEKFNLIHCHTPVASMLTRLAARKIRKNGTKVIYTAHGFHFFEGAPLPNWMIYYPIEWVCSFFTDVLITINKEDYNFAKKHMKAKKVCYVPGVGIDLEKYGSIEIEKNKKREELGIDKEAVMLLSVGELNSNKNHQIIIKAISMLKNKNIHYFIAGKGSKQTELESLVRENGLQDNVHFLGYRNDIAELCVCADIFCFPSFREGLPVSVMEAMATGLPCVVSDIRGNEDLIYDGKGGFLCNPNDSDAFARNIKILFDNSELRKNMGEYNKEKIKEFSLENVGEIMEKLYEEVIE